MESQVRTEVFAPLVEGNLREIVADFTVILPDGDFSAPALLFTDEGKFRFEVHLTNRESPRSLLLGSQRLLTAADHLTLRGTLGGMIAFECRDVFPANRSTTRSRGTSTLTLKSGRIHFPPEGTDRMGADELRALLKMAPTEPHPGTKKGHAHVIFHGPTIRLRHGRSATRQTNDFLGEASSETLDTHTFSGSGYEGALIQKDQELHLHLRSLDGASFSEDEWSALVKRIERCLGFTHGFHPWPAYREIRFDHRVLDRWISHHVHLNQTSLSPIARTMEFDLVRQPATPLASILPTLETGLNALSPDIQGGIEELLWHFRSNEFSELPPTTKLLMICTILDGLMKLFAGARTPNNKSPTDKMWKAGCMAAGLSWERWGSDLFECFGRHRRHLAHGWLLLPQNDDCSAYFEDYPRLAAGLNILVAARCGYEGPILSEPYSNEIVSLQSLKHDSE